MYSIGIILDRIIESPDFKDNKSESKADELKVMARRFKELAVKYEKKSRSFATAYARAMMEEAEKAYLEEKVNNDK